MEIVDSKENFLHAIALTEDASAYQRSLALPDRLLLEKYQMTSGAIANANAAAS
jgi:hypothetical protein